ncbi:MAG: hypothetical protein KKC03_13685 [Bacteroidetes bacterium]|nr:hypothetical protein [Bacteroidota bacterium]
MEPIEKYLKLRRLVDAFYDIQDVRMRTANRLRQMPKQTYNLYVGALKKTEGDLKKEISAILTNEPIFIKFFSRVRGVGPLISGFIISQTMIRFDQVTKKEFEKARDLLDDPEATEQAPFTPTQIRLSQKTKAGAYRVPQIRGIDKAPTVSAYWKWWGLHVEETGRGPRRTRGEKLNYNPKLRAFSWRIKRSFKMQPRLKSFYRRLYDRYKKRVFDNPRTITMKSRKVRSPPFSEILKKPQLCPRYESCKASLVNREEPACRGCLDNMAMKYACKVFLSHVWEQWRIQEGLAVRVPYAIEKLGHQTYIDWEPDR